MSEGTALLVKNALMMDTYYSINGDRERKYKITEGNFVLRGLRKKLQVKANIIRERILRISEYYGQDYLNATTVSYSGQIHYAVELMNKQHISLDETLPFILKRFGYSDNANARFQLKNRILDYLNKGNK